MSQEQRSTRTNRSYKLEPYDAIWAQEFESLKSQIAPLYGNNLVQFYHIGSTSVPGMLAKPVIDVCVVVKNLAEVKSIHGKFTELGYQVKGNYTGIGEEYFSYDENGERKYNIHTLQEGNPFIQGYISFRDYLRKFPDARDQYIAVKKDLRNKYGADDYNSYDSNKDAMIAKLKADALAWYRKNSSNAS